MQIVIVAAPILPGRAERWRRFMQEMLGSRCHVHEELRRRLGISKERVWIAHTPWAEMVIWYVEVTDAELLVEHLVTPDRPPGGWFKRHLLELYGLEVPRAPAERWSELLVDWQAQRGERVSSPDCEQ